MTVGTEIETPERRITMFELGTPEVYLRQLARQTERRIEGNRRLEQQQQTPPRARRFRRSDQA